MNLNEQIKAAAEAAREIASKAETEAREFTDVERDTVKGHLDTIERLKAEQAKANADQDLLARLGALGAKDDGEPVSQAVAQGLNTLALAGAKGGMGAPVSGSPGDIFLKSEPYMEFIKRHPNGIGEKARVDIDPVLVGGMKALINLGSPSGLVAPERFSYPVELSMWGRPLTVRDLVTVGQTGSDTVEYARLSSTTNAAAPVATATADGVIDGTTITNAQGGLKPQSAMVWAKETATVKTIAHWVAATRRALSDAGQLRTLIDQFLRYGLEEELEDQMVTGAGTGENFTGILNTSGVQAQAFSTSIPDTIRKAITKVRVTGKSNVNGILMNPADAETVDLLKDSTGRYFGAGPFGATGPSTLWGIPVVESPAMTAGFALVGDFRQAVLWDREQSTVTASEHHADFFIRNLVAVLGEMRAAFGVIRPAAFCNADIIL